MKAKKPRLRNLGQEPMQAVLNFYYKYLPVFISPKVGTITEVLSKRSLHYKITYILYMTNAKLCNKKKKYRNGTY
jgi:hypothetical protein